MTTSIASPLRALLLLSVLVAFPVPTAAQLSATSIPDWRTVPHFGLGYMAGAPHALLGGTAYVMRPWVGGLGFYADFHTSHRTWEGDEEFTTELTVQQARSFGDLEMRTVEHWMVLNVGVIRPLTRELAIFGGAGLARERFYREYFDGSLTRGFGGHYRISDESESGTRLNLTGGAVFRFGSSLNFHFGVESAPGFLVGISYLHANR